MARVEDNSQEFNNRFEEELVQFLREVGEVVANRARAICARKSGDLQNSIFYLVDEHDRSVRIGSDKDYAPMIELGSQPHIIRPNVKKALWWEGLEHPVSMVHHPGFAPIPFLRSALEASRNDISELAKERLG